jgi:hypothetical protein
MRILRAEANEVDDVPLASIIIIRFLLLEDKVNARKNYYFFKNRCTFLQLLLCKYLILIGLGVFQ